MDSEVTQGYGPVYDSAGWHNRVKWSKSNAIESKVEGLKER